MPLRLGYRFGFALLLALAMGCMGEKSGGTPTAHSQSNSSRTSVNIKSASLGSNSGIEGVWQCPRGVQKFEVVFAAQSPDVIADEVYLANLVRHTGSSSSQLDMFKLSSISNADGTISIVGEIEIVPQAQMSADDTFWLEVVDKNDSKVFVKQIDFVR